jgi:hypothetical protein
MADETNSSKGPSTFAKFSGILRDLATPLTVAIVGGMLSFFVNRQQANDANQRAYAELFSQRESADTNLRIEMFKTVLEGFLRQDTSNVQDQILKLVILAYNLNDSLNLGPLFQDVFRRVDNQNPSDPNRQRLTRVASDVVSKQVESLTFELGAEKDAVIDFDELKGKPEGISNLVDQVLTLNYKGEDAKNHPARRFKIDVLGHDPKMEQVTLRLAISPPGNPDGPPEVDARFAVGYFDFPAINNTRLSIGERAAVVIKNMDESSAKISLLYFPANRAGLNDRMYVEEVLDQMTRLRK